jgi:hypothetical protein
MKMGGNVGVTAGITKVNLVVEALDFLASQRRWIFLGRFLYCH